MVVPTEVFLALLVGWLMPFATAALLTVVFAVKPLADVVSYDTGKHRHAKRDQYGHNSTPFLPLRGGSAISISLKSVVL